MHKNVFCWLKCKQKSNNSPTRLPQVFTKSKKKKLEPDDPLKKNRKRAAYNFLGLIYNNVRKNERWSADPHPDPVRRKVTIDDWLWLSLVWSLTVSVWRDGTHAVGACPEMSSSCILFHHHGNRTCWLLLSAVGAVKDTARRCPRLKLFCLVWFGLVSVSFLILHLRLQHGVLVSVHSKHSAEQPDA